MKSKLIKPLSYKKHIKEWKSIIEDIRSDNRYDVMAVIDTETTGGIRKKGGTGASIMELDDPEMRGKHHRILEIGIIFCKRDKKTKLIESIKDSRGKDICIHEYLDPFSEPEEKRSALNTIPDIQKGAYIVHGITKAFLAGIEELKAGFDVNIKIDGRAAHFQDIVGDIIELTATDDENLSPIYGACHNSSFDAPFLDFEFENCLNENNEPYQRFQSIFLPFDTLHYFKDLVSKKEIAKLKKEYDVKKGEYSLDTLTSLMQKSDFMKEEFDRDLHGAYKDVLITISVYNALVKYSTSKQNKIKEPEKIMINAFKRKSQLKI